MKTKKNIILQKTFLNSLSSTGKLHIQNFKNNDNFCKVSTEYRGNPLIKPLSYVSEKCIIKYIKI